MNVMPAETTMHRVFCQNLRSMRAAGSLTQEAMADRLGMTQPQYAKIENGSHVPSLVTVERITIALGVSVAELLGSAHPMKQRSA